MQVSIKILNNRATMPTYGTPCSACFDLYAALEAPFTLYPNERKAIPTGLAFEIPGGYEMQVRPRSGNALRYGVTVLNTPGTIDADYRGEVKVILFNVGDMHHVIMPGDRIAQALIQPILRCTFIAVDEISQTERGENGFGSTGG